MYIPNIFIWYTKIINWKGIFFILEHIVFVTNNLYKRRWFDINYYEEFEIDNRLKKVGIESDKLDLIYELVNDIVEAKNKALRDCLKEVL